MFKKKKLKDSTSQVKCNSIENYDTPLQRKEAWRLRRLKIMRRHQVRTNFGGVPQ